MGIDSWKFSPFLQLSSSNSEVMARASAAAVDQGEALKKPY